MASSWHSADLAWSGLGHLTIKPPMRCIHDLCAMLVKILCCSGRPFKVQDNGFLCAVLLFAMRGNYITFGRKSSKQAAQTPAAQAKIQRPHGCAWYTSRSRSVDDKVQNLLNGHKPL